MFWVFTGYLNYLQFRINEVYRGAPTGLVGQSYLGCAIGIVSAFTAGWLAKRLGGPIRVAMIGFIVMIGSLILSLGDVWMLIAQVFVMCLDMFIIDILAAQRTIITRVRWVVLSTSFISYIITCGAFGA